MVKYNAAATIGATIPPPRLWEIFQIAPKRPRSCFGYHLASVMKDGPTPKPWKKPLRTTNTKKKARLSAKLIKILIIAQQIRPKAINFAGLALSARLLMKPLLRP